MRPRARCGRQCPGGETGRHAILRGWCRKASRFESAPGHAKFLSHRCTVRAGRDGCARCHSSSVVEHSIRNRAVVSSILTCGSRVIRKMRTGTPAGCPLSFHAVFGDGSRPGPPYPSSRPLASSRPPAASFAALSLPAFRNSTADRTLQQHGGLTTRGKPCDPGGPPVVGHQLRQGSGVRQSTPFTAYAPEPSGI